MSNNESLVPTPQAFSALSEYANLLAKHGPDAPEVREWFQTHQHLPTFEVNARELEHLERDDQDWHRPS